MVYCSLLRLRQKILMDSYGYTKLTSVICSFFDCELGYGKGYNGLISGIVNEKALQ